MTQQEFAQMLVQLLGTASVPMSALDAALAFRETVRAICTGEVLLVTPDKVADDA